MVELDCALSSIWALKLPSWSVRWCCGKRRRDFESFVSPVSVQWTTRCASQCLEEQPGKRQRWSRNSGARRMGGGIVRVLRPTLRIWPFLWAIGTLPVSQVMRRAVSAKTGHARRRARCLRPGLLRARRSSWPWARGGPAFRGNATLVAETFSHPRHMDRDLVADTARPWAEIRLERALCYKSKAVRPYLAGRRPVDLVLGLVLTVAGVELPSLGVECLHQHFARLGCEVPPRHDHDVLVDLGRNAVRMHRVARRRSPRWNGRFSATPEHPFDAGLRAAAVEVIPRSPAWRCASALSPSTRKARPASSPRRLGEGCAARRRAPAPGPPRERDGCAR